jgi:hypothetical protein
MMEEGGPLCDISVHIVSGRVITMLTVVLDYCLLATSPTYRADRSSPHPKLLIG